MVKIVRTSHSQKSESHHRSRFHFATPMIVLYRLSERFGNEMALLKHQLCKDFLQSDCEKRPENPCNFLIERPPKWIDTDSYLFETQWRNFANLAVLTYASSTGTNIINRTILPIHILFKKYIAFKQSRISLLHDNCKLQLQKALLNVFIFCCCGSLLGNIIW